MPVRMVTETGAHGSLSALEWNLLLTRHRKSIAENDVAVTFILYASRGGVEMTTIRLNVIAAVAKGRALMDDGWQVCITDPAGIRYQPAEFDKLASAKHTAS